MAQIGTVAVPNFVRKREASTAVAHLLCKQGARDWDTRFPDEGMVDEISGWSIRLALFELALRGLTHAIGHHRDDGHPGTRNQSDPDVALAQSDIDLLPQAVGSDQGPQSRASRLRT